jgi:hypothetical protein
VRHAAAASLAALILAGCGSSAKHAASPPASSGGSGADGAPPPSVQAPADPKGRAVKVISAWANTLRRGDADRAAAFFALPSVVVYRVGTQPLTIRTPAEAKAFNLALPCGAILADAVQAGRYVDATFRLVERPGGQCGSGAGQTARTAFVIHGGKILEWRRLPDKPTPGENNPVVPTGPSA